MTRYARSKGSKSSNERVPEDSTPWTAMKQQLLENNNELKNRDHEKAVNEQKRANYQKFLKEKEDEESKHAVWASFPIQRNKSLLLNHKLKNVKGKTESTVTKINKKKLKVVTDFEKNIQNVKKSPMDVGDNCNIKKGKKYKLQNNDINIDITPMTKVKKTKLNQSNKKEEILEKNGNSNVESKKIKKMSKSSKNKRKESTMNPKNESKAELTKNDLKKIEKKKQKRIKQLMKKKQFKAKVAEKNQQKQNNDVESKTQTFENTQNDLSEEDMKTDAVDDSAKNSSKKTSNLRKQVGTQKSKKKVHSFDDYQKRKPHLPHKLFINGKELEIAYVEGFPVKKEDAERLKKLRKEMISKGLPRSQIDAALKLERRRAEKALAREKKKVYILIYVFKKKKKSIFI